MRGIVRTVLAVATLPLAAACYEGSRIPPAPTATSTHLVAPEAPPTPTAESNEPKLATHITSGEAACFERRGYAVLPLSEGGVGGTRVGVIYDVAKEAEMIDDSVACTIEQIQKRKCDRDPSYGFCATPTPEAVQ